MSCYIFFMCRLLRLALTTQKNAGGLAAARSRD
jgi:hypothetical protein